MLSEPNLFVLLTINSLFQSFWWSYYCLSRLKQRVPVGKCNKCFEMREQESFFLSGSGFWFEEFIVSGLLPCCLFVLPRNNITIHEQWYCWVCKISGCSSVSRWLQVGNFLFDIYLVSDWWKFTIRQSFF